MPPQKKKNERIALEPVNPKLTPESLIANVTPENCHKEMDWGEPAGDEVW